MLKISTITSTLNAEKDIDEFVKNFSKQKYKFKELVIVDGGSTDLTIKKLNFLKKKYSFLKVLLKKKSSIYEALNYGIKRAKGQIINILGSDDKFLKVNCFNKVNSIFKKKNISFIYGNCIYTKNNRTIRVYSKKKFNLFSLNYGFMPAHTTLFIDKKNYKKLNYYSTKYRLASDFEFCYRLFKIKNIKFFYYNKYIVSMKSGGASNSSISNILRSNFEVYKILKKNGKKFILIRILFKLSIKIFELFKFKTSLIFKN